MARSCTISSGRWSPAVTRRRIRVRTAGRTSITSMARRCTQPSASRTTASGKPTPLARAIERIMVLDAVLAESETTWLATEREKVVHFIASTSVSGRRNCRTCVVRHAAVNHGPLFSRQVADRRRRRDRARTSSSISSRAGCQSTSARSSTAMRSCCARLSAWTHSTPGAASSGGRDSRLSGCAAGRARDAAQARHVRRAALVFRAATARADRPAMWRTRVFSGRRRRSAHRGFASCTARGCSTVKPRCRPRCRQFWQRRWHGAQGELEWHVLPHQYQHLAPFVGTA